MKGMPYGELFSTLLSALLSGGMLTVSFFFWRCLFSLCSLFPKNARAAFGTSAFSFCRENAASPFYRADAEGAGAFLYDFLTVLTGGILFLLFSYASLSGVFRFFALFFFLFGFALSERIFRRPLDLFFKKILPPLSLPAAFLLYSAFFSFAVLFRLAKRFLWAPAASLCALSVGRRRHRALLCRKTKETRAYFRRTAEKY